MISPHTPPGTKVVCINADEKAFNIPGSSYSSEYSWGLVEGETYTVSEITPNFDDCSVHRFQVLLTEINRGFWFGEPVGFLLGRFRRAELPSCLTEILNRAPIKQTESV